MPRLLVFGSVHLDHLVRVPRWPLPGETLTGQGSERQLGGKALNQALAAAHIVPTRLVVAVGDDRAGEQVGERLAAGGVSAYLETLPGLPTGESVALLEPGGENRAIILPGANRGLTAATVIGEIERFQPAMVITQLESQPDTTDRVLEYCASRGIPVLLNAAPYRPLAPVQLERLEYLVVNGVEARQLFGLEDPEVEVIPGASARHTVITLGAEGVVYFEGGYRSIRLPAPKVKVTTSHGAGDVFVGTLAALITQGHPIKAALEQSTLAASHHVEVGAASLVRIGPDQPQRR